MLPYLASSMWEAYFSTRQWAPFLVTEDCVCMMVSVQAGSYGLNMGHARYHKNEKDAVGIDER